MWKNEYIKKLFPINRNDINIEEAHQIKNERIPSSLYKYREINQFSIDSLLNESIWVTSADEFNDPYECFYTLSCDKFFNLDIKTFLNFKDFKKHIYDNNIDVEKLTSMSFDNAIKTILQSSQALISDDEVKHVLNAISNTSNEVHKLQLQKMVEHQKKSTFICCFSECKDSILMWSHYAKNHTGFCIEYNFKDKNNDIINTRALNPVIYTSDPLDMSDYFSSKDNFNPLIGTYISMFKNSHWSYEKEWRLIFPLGDSSKPFKRKSPKINAIYLGSKISNVDKEKITDIARRKGIKIFQMSLNIFEYKLDSILIN